MSDTEKVREEQEEKTSLAMSRFWTGFGEKWRYMWYTVSHPMDGYYWIRHAERGSVILAIVMIMLFSFSFSANRLVASFVVNDLDPRGIDSLDELVAVLVFFLILSVSNWSITCLMEGEGRLKDIVIALGYGTVPITVMLVAATIVSQAVADNERAFYYIMIAAGIAYGVIMMIVGIMQVHNYTFGKTVLTLFLTVVALLIIIFLILLLYNMLNMVYLFFYSIYTELYFRL
ncbi:MAG: YIP1 family protein [Lachnospiraceae bacterium]|nr:YIP1 family protein [Lachnospiraceae bacterium]